MNRQALMIFTKNPEYGKVKTRLASTIGHAAALEVYSQLLLHTLSVTRDLSVDKIVFYSNQIDSNDLWEESMYKKQIQQGADLGERMKNAFSFTFEKGYKEIVIIGTDCCDLTTGVIKNAFENLSADDAVIGPATDGGYYLLGLKQHCPELFEGINWSSDTVFASTIKKLCDLQLKYFLLPVLNDVDEAKDLVHLKTKIV
jgi:uncharacterized protein